MMLCIYEGASFYDVINKYCPVIIINVYACEQSLSVTYTTTCTKVDADFF